MTSIYEIQSDSIYLLFEGKALFLRDVFILTVVLRLESETIKASGLEKLLKLVR